MVTNSLFEKGLKTTKQDSQVSRLMQTCYSEFSHTETEDISHLTSHLSLGLIGARIVSYETYENVLSKDAKRTEIT